MEAVKKKIEELTALVEAKDGAVVVLAMLEPNPDNVQLTCTGRMNNLALLVGSAVVSDEDMRAFILKGVEAANISMKMKEKKKKIECLN